MRLRRWVYERLDRGGAEVDVDPAGLVEVADLRLFDGPRVVAALEQAGIPAAGVEAFDLASRTTTRMRVMVHRANLARASQIVARFR